MNQSPHTAAGVVLAFGGNVGDVPATIEKALAAIGELEGTAVVSVSAMFRTEPHAVGEDQDWYVNAAALITTTLDPETLRKQLEAIEVSLGRRSKGDMAPRSIDIDIIDYDGLILHSPGLTLPHPRMHQRRFVLAPLAEIAPDWVHPLLQLTTLQLLERCADTGVVEPCNKR